MCLALLLQIFVASIEGACNNTGLQYAVFKSNNSDRIDYATFVLNSMKDPSAGGLGAANLIYNSTTPSIGGWAGGCTGNFSIHGSPNVVPCEYMSVMYRGYLYPSAPGVYTFSISEIDDIAFIWIGEPAKKGWNRTNELLESAVGRTSRTQTVATTGQNATHVWLWPGNYYPIRIISGQIRISIATLISIVGPDGNPLLAAKTPLSNQVVQYSCDGTTAPSFAYDWGREL